MYKICKSFLRICIYFTNNRVITVSLYNTFPMYLLYGMMLFDNIHTEYFCILTPNKTEIEYEDLTLHVTDITLHLSSLHYVTLSLHYHNYYAFQIA